MSGELEKQTWDSMSELAVNAQHKLGTPSPLFAKVEDSDIEEYKKKLGTQN